MGKGKEVLASELLLADEEDDLGQHGLHVRRAAQQHGRAVLHDVHLQGHLDTTQQTDE